MKNTPVKSMMSPLECAVWGAEFVRVRAGTIIEQDLPSRRGQTSGGGIVRLGLSAHAVISAAIDAADQAVIDLREALGTEHSSLAMRECGDDHAARLDVLRSRLTQDQNDLGEGSKVRK